MDKKRGHFERLEDQTEAQKEKKNPLRPAICGFDHRALLHKDHPASHGPEKNRTSKQIYP